ncbi:MAG TPA: hypothetical protein VIG06_00940, partial [Kofleriaceae bacterium]
RRLGTVPLDCGWSDLGSWAALAEVRVNDAAGNAIVGDGLALDSTGSLVFNQAEGPVAIVGARDLVVVRTGDAVLVMPKDRSQDVRRLLAELEASGRRDLL